MGCIVDAIAYPSKYLSRHTIPEDDDRHIKISVTKKISIYGTIHPPRKIDNLSVFLEGMSFNVTKVRIDLQKKIVAATNTRQTTPESISVHSSGDSDTDRSKQKRNNESQHGRNSSKCILVYSHGNAETIKDMHLCGMILAEIANMPVLIYDYEGYGASGGKSGEKAARRDVEAVYRYVRENYPDHRMIFMGRSIGSVSVAHIANKYANASAYKKDREKGVMAGVIIQSGLASALQAMREHRVNTKCDCLRNFDKVANWAFPCMILHGTCDEVVPVHNAVVMSRYVVKKNYPEYVASFKKFMQSEGPLWDMPDHAMYCVGNFKLLLVAGGDHNSYDWVNYEVVFPVLMEFMLRAIL